MSWNLGLPSLSSSSYALDNFHNIPESQILQRHSKDNKTKLQRVVMRLNKITHIKKALRKLWPCNIWQLLAAATLLPCNPHIRPLTRRAAGQKQLLLHRYDTKKPGRVQPRVGSQCLQNWRSFKIQLLPQAPQPAHRPPESFVVKIFTLNSSNNPKLFSCT